MQTIENIFFCRYEVKKSTFIAYVSPYSEFETLRAKLQGEHPKAAHIVWAYRYLNEFHQIVENGSDDGEPKGTSAPPILNVLRGGEIVNAAVLVVRYFGGVKLGTGGLARAYGTAVKMVLDEAIFTLYERKEEFAFSCDYSFVQRAEHFLSKIGVDFKNRSFETDKVIWHLMLTEKQKDELQEFLKS